MSNLTFIFGQEYEKIIDVSSNVMILQVNGYGIDIRQRKIWKRFVGTDLREKALNPEKDLLSDSDFLIGNHTDELTPWIPILAARLNYFMKLGFFAKSIFLQLQLWSKLMRTVLIFSFFLFLFIEII